MARSSSWIYLQTHEDLSLTAVLLRRREGPGELPIKAWARTEAEALASLEAQVAERLGSGELPTDFQFEAPPKLAELKVDVHPWTSLEGVPAIGARTVPLILSYAYTPIKGGAYRVMMPRFGWWFVVERLATVKGVVTAALGSSLMGARGIQLFDYRPTGPDELREWRPAALREARPRRTPADGLLSSVAEDWTGPAAQRRAPLLVGEGDAAPRMAELLAGERPRSILVVGPEGSGKTAAVRMLARFLTRQPVEGADGERRTARLWATDAARLVSGTPWLGMWQARCLDLVAALAEGGDPLYVGDLWPLVDDRSQGASLWDLLRPPMAGGEITLIAEATPEALVRVLRRDPDAVQGMAVVRIPPIAPSALPELLSTYGRRRGTPSTLSPAGATRLMSHLTQLCPGQGLPGAGIRFMDWLHTDPGSQAPAELGALQVSQAFSRYNGVPVELIADEYPRTVEDLAGALSARVVGQELACEGAARVLARFKAGLADPGRPVGSLLLVGPTGVGKTQLARELARLLFGDPARMIRLDMSEYMLPHSASRLLDAGKGSRSLAAQVRQQPLSLVLFDEIEKAHPRVFDLLLGVLGEGRLTDSEGRAVAMGMTLVVMTSNLGATSAGRVGFNDDGDGGHLKAVRDHFRPELVGRLDQILPFRRLTPRDLRKVVDLELKEVAGRPGLSRRRLRLHADEAARDTLAERGYDPKRGARPLKRVIEEQVATPIAVEIARDPALRDREIWVVRGADLKGFRRLKPGALLVALA